MHCLVITFICSGQLTWGDVVKISKKIEHLYGTNHVKKRLMFLFNSIHQNKLCMSVMGMYLPLILAKGKRLPCPNQLAPLRRKISYVIE